MTLALAAPRKSRVLGCPLTGCAADTVPIAGTSALGISAIEDETLPGFARAGTDQEGNESIHVEDSGSSDHFGHRIIDVEGPLNGVTVLAPVG